MCKGLFIKKKKKTKTKKSIKFDSILAFTLCSILRHWTSSKVDTCCFQMFLREMWEYDSFRNGNGLSLSQIFHVFLPPMSQQQCLLISLWRDNEREHNTCVRQQGISYGLQILTTEPHASKQRRLSLLCIWTIVYHILWI